MKNLKNPKKKSYFKLIAHIAGILLLIGIILYMGGIIDKNKRDYSEERLGIIRTYEMRMIEKDSINAILSKREKIYKVKIDSLILIKGKTIIKYAEKNKVINSATAFEHARWLDSVTSKVNSVEE